MAALLGCIADDFTGGTDLAGMLVKHGMRTVQMIGVPQGRLPEDVDAVVVALKSRTTPVPEAVAESLAALRTRSARASPSPARHFPLIDAPSIRATCSWATCR